MSLLNSNIHQLLNEHIVQDGIGGYTPNDPLIEQLAKAVTPDMGGGQSSSGGAKIPVNATAVALQQDIQREAREDYAAMYFKTPPSLEAILTDWANADLAPEWSAYLERRTGEWCTKINKLLSPLKPYHPSRPCPSCGDRYHGPDRNPTLSVHWLNQAGDTAHPQEWTMDCGACKATWDGDNLGAIALAMQSKDGLP